MGRGLTQLRGKKWLILHDAILRCSAKYQGVSAFFSVEGLACGGRRARNAGTQVPRGGTESSSRLGAQGQEATVLDWRGPSANEYCLFANDFLHWSQFPAGDIQGVEVLGLDDGVQAAVFADHPQRSLDYDPG